MRDVEHVIKIVQRNADRARIDVAVSAKNEAFAMRLMHAADYQFGLMAEIVVLAVSHALFTQGFEAKLSIRHFAEVYSERNGAEAWMNVFVAEDYGRLIRLFHQANGIVLKRFDVEAFALKRGEIWKFHVFSFPARIPMVTEASVLSANRWKTFRSWRQLTHRHVAVTIVAEIWKHAVRCRSMRSSQCATNPTYAGADIACAAN